jgi:hypothetical protein
MPSRREINLQRVLASLYIACKRNEAPAPAQMLLLKHRHYAQNPRCALSCLRQALRVGCGDELFQRKPTILNPSHIKVAHGPHVLSEVSSWHQWSLLMSRRIAPRSTMFPIT